MNKFINPFNKLLEALAKEDNSTETISQCQVEVNKKERSINMAVFGSPFSGLANEKKLTDAELIRAIRFMIAAEYEATQLYMQLAESTNNRLAVAVLKDIANEERVHVGEFLRLLRELAPDEEKFYGKGSEEVERMIKKMK